MADFTTVTLTHDAGIATLTLNRPDKRNAVSFELVGELMHALDAAETSAAQVIIVSGAGKAFCAGLDLEELKSLIGRSQEQNLKDSQTMANLFRTIYDFPKPTIAMISGYCIGGGLGLATCCDLRICSDNSRIFETPSPAIRS